MKHYKINEAELQYLSEIVNYLNSSEEPLSGESHTRVCEVMTRIKSRPVMDIIIDSDALKAAQKELLEETKND